MFEILLDSVLDTLKLVPFLFFTYLLMEYIEHRSGGRMERAIESSGRFGPLIGGLFGLIPQCGFSSVAANFFSGHMITMGTLVAIFISTSDEMLPILIGSSIPAGAIVKILGIKLIAAVAAGFIVDLILHRPVGHDHEDSIHEICEEYGCHCENSSIFRSAAKHTLSITIFIFIVILAFGILMAVCDFESISNTLFGIPVLGEIVAALIGIIPNCAASVMLTNLYVSDLMPAGALIAGLAMNSGVGIAILFKMNRHPGQNIKIVVIVFTVSIIAGLLVGVSGIQI